MQFQKCLLLMDSSRKLFFYSFRHCYFAWYGIANVIWIGIWAKKLPG